jgi:hypothetical protein
MPKGQYRRQKLGGRIRPLDPADARSWDHPCHREQWLALAEALGRSLARRDWALMKAENADRLRGQEREITGAAKADLVHA